METSDNTLDQIHSIFVRQTCRNLDSINSMCMYYNTVSKRILIITNKHIHIISTHFLAAANNKHMRLFTSLYGSVFVVWSVW